ncbi:MAG TPA: ATP-binding protein [Methylocystis sp.]|nr:ATP-binding protein [Methylocystis sp.]
MGSTDREGDLFRLAIEASPAAMIVTDGCGAIEFANAETEHMFGYAAADLIGKSIDILVPKPVRAGHKSLRENFLRNPSKRPMGVGRDLRAVRRDLSEFPVEIGLNPIETETGMKVLATVLDITARREAEAALAQHALELERANERLAQFAYVASHDLQEPLRKIAAFSDVHDQAIERGDREETLYARAVIRNSALRARQLVDDLLSYSRAINDAQQLQRLDLHDEIVAAVDDLSEIVNGSGAAVEIEAPHVSFEADRSLFARLIHNIVSNAIKYRRPDVPAKVRIAVELKEPGKAHVTVSDNGVGFEMRYAATILEPFKRLRSRAEYPGTGIGLAICKSIVDRHRWELSVNSRPGVGSTFTVTLPVCA